MAPRDPFSTVRRCDSAVSGATPARSLPVRLITMPLLALVLALLGGCNAPPPDADLVFGIAQAPQNLDPRLATDAASSRVNRLLYERLVEFDEVSRPVPGIATWERVTPTRYRVTLRALDGGHQRVFSDGSRLVAADVAATYASILDPATASPHRAVLSIIRDIRVLDADRLEFDLREPDPQFPAYLGIGILPARLATANAAPTSADPAVGTVPTPTPSPALTPVPEPPARAPVGSGGFRLLAWPAPGRLVLERRRDGLRVALVTVKDPNVRVMKLLRGEVDLLQNDLTPELIGLLRERPGIAVETAPGINYSYLGANLQHPATGDLRVRQAIAHAIDREGILRALYRGAGRPAEGLFPPEHWAGHPALVPHAHDPARARALLAAAGYGPERPLRLQLKTSSDPTRLRLATVIQAQLAAVGIDAAVQSYDWGTFFGDIKAGRFELYGLTWVGIRNPDIFRYAFHSDAMPPTGANRGGYHNPAADDLIERARREPDPARQAGLYRDLQALLHADLPYIPLWYEDQVLARRAAIHGYRLAPDGNYDALSEVGIAGD